MGPKVTSHDVARRAGVSRTTVSMVINNYSAVTLSAATRERVLKAAAELGYQPNSAGRMLVRGDTETIGLVIGDRRILPFDAFVPHMLYGIGMVNRQHGYHVLLEGFDPSGEPASYQSLVDSRRIDGLIVLNPRPDDPELRALIDRGFPLVLAGSVGKPNEYAVDIAPRAGLTAAVDYVMSLGHRRIGTVPFSGRDSSTVDVRVAGLRTALEERGLELLESDIEAADFSAESGALAAARLLARRPDLTAIFAGNDTIAIGVISAAMRLGKDVPNDLSIVGFDDLPFAAYLSPPLTTIRTDAFQQGAKAAEMLVQILKGAHLEERHLRIETELVVRATCATARS